MPVSLYNTSWADGMCRLEGRVSAWKPRMNLTCCRFLQNTVGSWWVWISYPAVATILMSVLGHTAFPRNKSIYLTQAAAGGGHWASIRTMRERISTLSIACRSLRLATIPRLCSVACSNSFLLPVPTMLSTSRQCGNVCIRQELHSTSWATIQSGEREYSPWFGTSHRYFNGSCRAGHRASRQGRRAKGSSGMTRRRFGRRQGRRPSNRGPRP